MKKVILLGLIIIIISALLYVRNRTPIPSPFWTINYTNYINDTTYTADSTSNNGDGTFRCITKDGDHISITFPSNPTPNRSYELAKDTLYYSNQCSLEVTCKGKDYHSTSTEDDKVNYKIKKDVKAIYFNHITIQSASDTLTVSGVLFLN